MEKQCDDVAFMRETLQKILKKEGDSCAGPAQNGAQLRSLLDKTISDYLLLDIHLGTENGLDLLQEIQCRDLPTKVVMVTADNSKECIESDTSHGADAYVIKPSNEEHSFIRWQNCSTDTIRQGKSCLLAARGAYSKTAKFFSHPCATKQENALLYYIATISPRKIIFYIFSRGSVPQEPLSPLQSLCRSPRDSCRPPAPCSAVRRRLRQQARQFL